MQKWIKKWDDKQISAWLALLLRIGVISSALLVVTGAIFFFIQHPEDIYNYKTFKGEPEKLRLASQILKNAIQLRGRAIIQFGLLLLIATPILRVLFSLLGFIFEKDWVYVGVTLLVFLVLLNSLLTI